MTCKLEFDGVKKAPLSKGGWHGECRDWGIQKMLFKAVRRLTNIPPVLASSDIPPLGKGGLHNVKFQYIEQLLIMKAVR